MMNACVHIAGFAVEGFTASDNASILLSGNELLLGLLLI